MKQRAQEKNDPRYQNRDPFTGKLICGECGATLKRRINSTGSQRYPVWVCKQHLENVDDCSLKSIRESDLEYAFMTMINKLIFSRKEVLHTLLKSVQGETHENNLRRIEEIDRKLEKNVERAQMLTTIMSKGHIGPALFKKESNELAAESEALADEKERLIKSVTGNVQRADEISNLVKFVDRADCSDLFDEALVDMFLDHATIHSRTDITFHLKCGLNLLERM